MISNLFEIGFFSALWNWSNPLLTAALYIAIAAGFAMQYLLQRKCRIIILRFCPFALYLVGIIFCAYQWNTLSGWDTLSALFILGFIFCLIFGALLAILFSFLKNKFKMRKGEN